MNAIAAYGSEISSEIGQAWNRFWFTPRDTRLVSILRILVGLLAVYFILSHTADLSRWFGQYGLLPVETVRQLAGGPERSGLRPSPLFYLQNPSALWAFHIAAILISVAFILGIFSRITNAITLATVLSYIHRGPMISGQFEPVLTMLLVYLLLAPTGNHFAVDNRLRKTDSDGSTKSVGANLCLQLIRLHTCGFYLVMGLTMLAGQVWWSGDAAWWLIARPDSRPIDLTGIHGQIYLINLWTHGTVAFALLFPLLIWKQSFRPLLLALAACYWLLLAILTGLFAFAAVMFVASLAFLPTPAEYQTRDVQG